VVGEVIQTHINQDCLTDGKPDAGKVDPLIYSPGSGNYQRLGDIVGKAFSIGKQAR
jgi:flavin reductase (DIM6/NTAB) family NADH-FMN oxidoreductase RutF